MNGLVSFEAAYGLHVLGSLAGAESAYREILSGNPGHVNARHYLGVVLHQQGQTANGLSLIRETLEASPESASRFNDLGNILAAIGDLPPALAAFRKALVLDPSNPDIRNNEGAVLFRQQDLSGAEAAFRQALLLRNDFASAMSNLATVLTETGRDEEAFFLACKAFILPPLEGKHPRQLGIAYYRLGMTGEAALCYRKWLESEPDNPVARHHYLACSHESAPIRAADDFVTTVFDEMAAEFDSKLVGKLGYRGPEIIATLLEHSLPLPASLRVLDGGCGTGLCAPVLSPFAAHLTGVDLSTAMLDKARARGLYHELVVSELTTYLQRQESEFGLIAMADTLIYFGDLVPIFLATARALSRGGLFVFTVEAAPAGTETPGYRLAPNGRYRHDLDYLKETLMLAGFKLLECREETLRSEFCQPIPGFGVAARIQSR